MLGSPDFFTTQLVTPRKERKLECMGDTDEIYEEVVCVAANAKDFELQGFNGSEIKSTRSHKSFNNQLKASIQKP